ncbi:MAG: Transcription-repair-coupling factor [Sodalis sp.]|nr:MAG: Transcription-repair-coupling factor [Sodalis sp.]
MPGRDRYTLPTKTGKKLTLGQLTGAAIVDRYPRSALPIISDMQSTLRLYNAIRGFTHHPVLTLPDWEIWPYDS